MRKLAVKYCGSCNPQIDLSRLGAELTNIATELGADIVPLEHGDIDVVVILCGCPRACGNQSVTRSRARRSVLVAGYCVDGNWALNSNILSLLREGTMAALKR